MRFTEFGPSIPNLLLDARDEGEVVFLCGAGLSIPAGLPDFFRLTRLVVDQFCCAPDPSEAKLIDVEQRRREAGQAQDMYTPISFDRIFTLLVRDFGVSQVELEVAKALRVRRQAKLEHHFALLDLARGPDGRRRLITTNFDRLFQKADAGLRIYAPPRFPNLSERDGFDGVVHLHGLIPARITEPLNEIIGLVLSGADFGRAYLSDAWATRFVCELLDRYIVVLLGYSADDPPVRYLLEGLNASGRIREQRLYAFTADDPARSQLDWLERGVTPIIYDPADHHKHLWESIRAWAARARNVEGWRSDVAKMAGTPPAQLKPFERGQVAALCSSVEGARAFASKVPSPPAEWLCVLDAVCRYAKPSRTLTYDFTPSPEVDPLADYGLDDDPPRPDQQRMERDPPGIDILAPLKTDEPVAREQAIIRGWRWSGGSLNARLSQIMLWIESVMASSTAVWWAAGRGTLHDQLRGRLSWVLDRDNIQIDPLIRQAWRLILEAQDTAPDDLREGWDAVSSQIRKEGWSSPRSVRAFAAAARPRLTVRRSWRHAPIPPSNDETISLSHIGDFEVLYPKLIESVDEVPDALLGSIVAVTRTNLEYGAALEKEVSDYYPRLPTLHPENKPGEHFYSNLESYYISFCRLFQRLAAFDVATAACELRCWNGSVRFFLPLRLFALADAGTATGAEVGREICAMSREAFWSSQHSRELLWTLRARWNCLPGRYRKAIEKKLVDGREKYDFENDREYVESRAILSAARLTWMQGEGLKLTADTCARLPKLKDLNPRWQDALARSADASMESRSGWIKQETDMTPIEDLPIPELIARCDALAEREFASFTHYDPFRGLVQTDL